MNNALSAAEQAILRGDEEKLYEALKAMGVQNLQAQNKGWYLKQLQADRENKEQVAANEAVHLCKGLLLRLLIIISPRLLPHQGSPGEALTKDELQNGVDVANEIAEGYLKSMHINNTHFNTSRVSPTIIGTTEAE